MFGWAVSGVDPSVPSNGGPECIKFLSPMRKVTDTFLAFMFASMLIVWSYKHLTVPGCVTHVRKDRTGLRVLLVIMSLIFGIEIGFKFATRTMIYILNPCHVTTAVQIYLLAATPSKKVTYIFRIHLNFLNGAVLAFLFPVTESRILPFEAATYWIQHCMMMVVPYYLLRLGGVYNIEKLSDYSWSSLSYGLNLIYHFGVLQAFAVKTEVNLNHIMCPIALDPFYGPYYRIATMVHQAILCPLDGLEDTTDIINDDNKKPGRSETVDLTDNSLLVDISDALSEKDKVKFTVHTKTTLPDFQKPEFLVVRQHEEFVWLHDRFEENEDYAGYIIPPAPPRPDFDASREKLQKLGEGEGTMTKEEFTKMKQELEAEYLATFKKTVAMHEVFLCRLANHPIFRNDHNFRVFLEYDQDLCVRGKNKMEVLGGFMKSFSKTTDELLLSATGVKDGNEFFEQEKVFLIDYYTHLKDATAKSDRMTKRHKDVADCYMKISMGFIQLSTIDNSNLEKFLTKVAETFEKARKIEGRVASDEDLKLSDTLRYYMRDTFAAKQLLYRRLRCLADYENANRNLEKARTKNKDIHAAELAQQQACEKFEQMSEKAKEELMDFKTRRVAAFRKNLVELAELEIKHAKAQILLFKNCLAALKEE